MHPACLPEGALQLALWPVCWAPLLYQEGGGVGGDGQFKTSRPETSVVQGDLSHMGARMAGPGLLQLMGAGVPDWSCFLSSPPPTVTRKDLVTSSQHQRE